MNLLTKEQMLNLTTKRLLSYKKTLMQVPETPDWDSNVKFDGKITGQITKASPEWKETYQALKEVLSKREHLEKK